MGGEKIQRPAGWYSKAEREQRSAAWAGRRTEAAARRADRDRARLDQEAAAERRLGPIRAYARRTLEEIAAQRAVEEERKKKTEARAKAPKPKSKRAQRRAKIKEKEKPATLADKWKHKQGTPETHEHFSKRREGALARLHESGSIDDDQLAWAHEIAAIAERIEGDVAVRTASLEARVDASRGNDGAICESLQHVRAEMAYTRWRERAPQPRRAVLDMIVGDAIGYTLAAKRYCIHNRRAKRILIEALNLWPDCKAWARGQINAAELAAMQAGLM